MARLTLSGSVFLATMAISIVALADTVAPDDVQVSQLSISESLSGKPGDPVEGRKVFADRGLGNCLACHVNSEMTDQQWHGEVGPSLDGVATRWKPEQLRTIVVNSKLVFTDLTIMPAFYSLDVGENVREDLKGVPILTAQQVEDVVAYLETLN